MRKALIFLLITMCLTFTACSNEKHAAQDNREEVIELDELKGNINENSYENKILDLKWETADINWILTSREDTDEMYNEIVKTQGFDEGGSFVDMYATNEETLCSVEVIVEQIKSESDTLNEYVNYSAEAYDEIYKKQGATNVDIEISNIEFAGKNCDCIYLSFMYESIPVYQVQAVYEEEGYFVSVVAVSYNSFEEAEECLDNFKGYKK